MKELSDAKKGRHPNFKVKPICSCGNEMVLRNGRHGEFFGCSTYPKCRNTREADGSRSRFERIRERHLLPYGAPNHLLESAATEAEKMGLTDREYQESFGEDPMDIGFTTEDFMVDP